jgi:hypothetical protein
MSGIPIRERSEVRADLALRRRLHADLERLDLLLVERVREKPARC